MMKTIWDIVKAFIVALVIAISFEMNFSYAEILGLSDNKATWTLNVTIHTGILSIIFLLLESFVKKNSVTIESYLYTDKEFKYESNHLVLKVSEFDKNNSKELFLHIKVNGKRSVLPKYITLSYTEDLTLQINRKGEKYIKIDDKKNIIKIRLRGFLQNEPYLNDAEKTFHVVAVADGENSVNDQYKIKPKCWRIQPFIILKTRAINIKVKED